MNLPQKIKNILWIIFAVAVVVLCIVWFLGNDLKHIEDTNGADNYDLQTITDENICKMDIGALEADWRAAYAAAIAPSDSRFAVRSADPSVTLSGNGTVSIPDGASVLLAWRGFGAGKYIRYRLRFNVSPGAVLAAEVNGDETICGTPGEQELEFMSSLVSNDVVLAARGGTIELAGCAADRGFSVHIR